MKHLTTITLILSFLSTTSFSQDNEVTKALIYKTVDTTSLKLHFYYPDDFSATQQYPAIIFFFGGGWIGGSIKQFKPHASYFSERGMIAILADYRIKKKHGTTPFDALKDAKSAVRYLRAHAKSLNIDPQKIAAAGGSAGGQLAAACATAEKFNAADDDLSISPRPDALILFNPVIDNGPGGYGYNRIGEQYHDFSPLHNIHEGAPPTIMFLGTDDKHLPVETAQYYKMVMEKVGSRCDVVLFDGQQHGFFNHHKNDGEFYRKTVAEADTFLVSLGYLTAQ